MANQTRFQLHVQEWINCTACDLHTTRLNVVFARGSVPCDILFIGEAPGESENIVGQPFVGPAGRLLDHIVDRFIGEENIRRERDGLTPFKWAFTNLVACIPPEDEKGGKEPAVECVQACSSRLLDFVKICDGDNQRLKLIVCVGGSARDYLDQKYRTSVKLHRRIPMIDIYHPAYILRQHIAARGLITQQESVKIASTLVDLDDLNWLARNSPKPFPTPMPKRARTSKHQPTNLDQHTDQDIPFM